jgi:signal transduction histidine kinase
LEFIENTQLVIRGSKQALHIILRNLLNNSMQYTTQGKITIRVQQNSVIIEDTGPGISEAIQNKIFERFFRGEPDKFTHHTGVGLALVKQLCTLCKWEISLDTGKKNSGTRFIFSFPH